MVPQNESDAALHNYISRHPRAWERFQSILENTLGTPVTKRNAPLPWSDSTSTADPAGPGHLTRTPRPSQAPELAAAEDVGVAPAAGVCFGRSQDIFGYRTGPTTASRRFPRPCAGGWSLSQAG